MNNVNTVPAFQTRAITSDVYLVTSPTMATASITGMDPRPNTKPMGEWDERIIPRPFNGQYLYYLNGKDNDAPARIKQMIQMDSIAAPILTKKSGILWGLGPVLYEDSCDAEGNPARLYRPCEGEIKKFLHENNWIMYLRRCMMDFHYCSAYASLVYLNKSAFTGQSTPKNICKIEHISVNKVRLACSTESISGEPTHAIIASWDGMGVPDKSLIVPLFDPFDPLAHPLSLHWVADMNFNDEIYPSPDFLGGEQWMKRSRVVPEVLEAMTDNSLNIRWHIKSPANYWENIRNNIMATRAASGQSMSPMDVDQEVKSLQDAKISEISNVLAGLSNTGKFFHSVTSYDRMPDGSVKSSVWEIEQIDLKVKDFVEAQLKISERADSVKVGAFGLHSSLSNVGQSGKSDSGSEQLYAMTNHLLTDVCFPEYCVTKALNDVLSARFSTELRVGFYRQAPRRQQDVSSKDRVKNNPV